METNKVDAPASATRPPPASTPADRGAAIRLVILLGLLLLVIGAYGYDYFLARTQCETADKNVQQFVDAQNRKGVGEAPLVTSPDIQKTIGFAPTWTEEHDDKGYTVEYYCWWGQVPLLTRRRHFIAVVYVGSKPRHYSSHYREEPPPEAFPIVDANPKQWPGKDDPITTPPDSASGNPGKDKSAPPDKDEKPADKSTGDDKKPADSKP
jgi:hypothetical protein